MISSHATTLRRLAVIVTLTVCTASPISAQTNPPAKDTKPPAPPPFAKGPIAKLDLAAKQLTLTLKDGPHTYAYTDRTYIFRGKEKITADKLKPGETIALSLYADADGHVFVRRIKAPESSPPATDTEKKPEPSAQP